MEKLLENLPSATQERFEGLLARQSFAAVEEAWMEELASAGDAGPGDPSPFLSTADALIASGEKDRAGVLLELLLPAYQRTGGAPARLQALRRLIVLSPRRSDLRAGFAACYREIHGEEALPELCLSISGVEASAEPVKALTVLDRLLAFRPGSCVYHASGWGVGTVESVDATLRQAVVDLEKKRQHRIDLKFIADILEPIPDDHFLSLARDGGARLRSVAETDPVQLVGTVLQSFGNPLELKAIKARLVPLVISSDGWSRWWNRTKALLRDSGFYRVSDRAPFVVERLKRSVSYEDELLRQFEAGDWSVRLSIAKKHCRGAQTFPRLRERAVEDLRGLFARESGARGVECAAILERIVGESGAVLEALRKVKDLVGAVLGIEGTEERRRAVEVLREAHPEAWQQAALELLQKGDDAVRDEAARLLIGSPSEARARSLIADAVHAPRNYPELFAWCCRAHMGGEDSPLLQPFKAYPPQEILGRVFDALDNLGMRSERDGKAVVRDTLARVRALLTVEESRFFREVVQPLAREDARGVYRRVLSSGGLSEPLRVKLLEILMAEFPDITRDKVRPIWEDDFIYVTEGGLAKKQAEFRDITEEKLPKNFQDIGRAAAFGDLSENAEYTSALEERDRLTKRATEIKAQLDRVRIIKPDMLKSGEITLGARVRLFNAHTKHEVGYRILGPWDGGPEDGVLNYGSPLGITLLGKRVGDEVEAQLPGGAERFRVVEVGSAFEPDASSR